MWADASPSIRCPVYGMSTVGIVFASNCGYIAFMSSTISFPSGSCVLPCSWLFYTLRSTTSATAIKEGKTTRWSWVSTMIL